MRATIYTCTVQSGKHSYQIVDLHNTVIKLGSQCSSVYVLNRSICTADVRWNLDYWAVLFYWWVVLVLCERVRSWYGRLILSGRYGCSTDWSWSKSSSSCSWMSWDASRGTSATCRARRPSRWLARVGSTARSSYDRVRRAALRTRSRWRSCTPPASTICTFDADPTKSSQSEGKSRRKLWVGIVREFVTESLSQFFDLLSNLSFYIYCSCFEVYYVHAWSLCSHCDEGIYKFLLLLMIWHVKVRYCSLIVIIGRNNSTFHPSGVGKWVVIRVITWIAGVQTIKRHIRTACSCLIAGQSPWARAWTAAYRLYARTVCDAKAPLQLRYAACGAI